MDVISDDYQKIGKELGLEHAAPLQLRLTFAGCDFSRHNGQWLLLRRHLHQAGLDGVQPLSVSLVEQTGGSPPSNSEVLCMVSISGVDLTLPKLL